MLRRRGVPVCIILLLVLSIAPTISAGPLGGGPPRGPPSPFEPDGGAGTVGAGSGGNETGPQPPPLSPPSNISYAPPYANLRIRGFRADRQAVGVGSSVNFTLDAENAGHLVADRANLTLYDNVISNGTAIAWTDVDLWDFEATVVMSWTASGTGNHTIIAFVDANYTVEETNESDNTASVVVQVIGGSSPGVPDVDVNEGDIGVESMPQAGQSGTIKVRVRNVGDGPAYNVTVRVEDNGVTVDYYTVGLISAASENVRSITWTPSSEGPHFINVTTEEEDDVWELREDNNVASMGIHVNEFPFPICYHAKYDYTIPVEEVHVYDHCVVWATNVTVYGTLRLLNGSLLIVGDWYALSLEWPRPLPIPYPDEPHSSVVIESGGALELYDSGLTAATATYGYGFEAKAGSALHMNRSNAYFPWGKWPFYRARSLDGDITYVIPGGLIVRTSNFTFENSTVAFGRLHGLYLAQNEGFGTLSGDTFRDNNLVGLFVDAGAIVNVTSGTFRENGYGLLANASSPLVEGSDFTRNRYGLRVERISSTVMTGSNATSHTIAGVWLENTAAGAPRITAYSNILENRFGSYARHSSLSVDNSTFDRDSSDAVFDGLGSAGFEHNTASAYNYSVTVARGSIARIAENVIGTAYLPPSQRAPNTIYEWTAVACSGSTCEILENDLPTVCRGVLIIEEAGATIVGNNVSHIDCRDDYTWAIRVQDSTASIRENELRWSFLQPRDYAVSIFFGTDAEVANNTIERVLYIVSSPGAFVYNNTKPNYHSDPANITIENHIALIRSSNSTISRNRVFGDDDGIELQESRDMLLEWNELDGRNCVTPGSDPPRIDRGLVKIYTNSSATLRNNVLKCGSWGISLDDRQSGQIWHRGNYALIEDNTIEDNGLVAVGVDTSSEADVLHNWINGSSGWGIFMESGSEGNRIENNSMRDCHGVIDFGLGGCIVFSYETYQPIGQTLVANNTMQNGNVTGIYARRDHDLTIRDGFIPKVNR